MPADSTAKAARSPTARSRVSNGSHLGVGDGRSKWARRLRDLIDAYTADLGDADSLGEMKRSLIRRAATMTVELERAEAVFAEKGEAEPQALAEYQTTVNSLRRTLETLGLNRPGASQPQTPDRSVPGDARETLMGRIAAMTVSDVALGVGRQEAKYEVARRIAHMIAVAKESGEKLPLSIANLAVDLALAIHRDEPEPEAESPAEQERKAAVERGHDGPDGTVWDYPANANKAEAANAATGRADVMDNLTTTSKAPAPEPEPKPEVHVPHAKSRTLASIRVLTSKPVPMNDGGLL